MCVCHGIFLFHLFVLLSCLDIFFFFTFYVYITFFFSIFICFNFYCINLFTNPTITCITIFYYWHLTHLHSNTNSILSPSSNVILTFPPRLSVFFFFLFVAFLSLTGAPPVPINKCAKCDKTVYKAEEVTMCHMMWCDTMLCIFVSFLHSFLPLFHSSTSFLPFLSYSSSTHPLPSHSTHHSSSLPPPLSPHHSHTHIGVLLRRCVAQELLYMRCALWRWVQQSLGER